MRRIAKYQFLDKFFVSTAIKHRIGYSLNGLEKITMLVAEAFRFYEEKRKKKKLIECCRSISNFVKKSSQNRTITVYRPKKDDLAIVSL